MKAILFVAIMSVCILSSCQRCMKCEYTDRDDVLHSDDVCGSKDETDALYQAYKDSSIANRSKFYCTEDF